LTPKKVVVEELEEVKRKSKCEEKVKREKGKERPR
jgi:hypothetical protein